MTNQAMEINVIACPDLDNRLHQLPLERQSAAGALRQNPITAILLTNCTGHEAMQLVNDVGGASV
jgi:hypothetical protein